MKYRIYRHWWQPETYYAELLGSLFPGCYGQGSTPEGAVASLKIRIGQVRNLKQKMPQ